MAVDSVVDSKLLVAALERIKELETQNSTLAAALKDIAWMRAPGPTSNKWVMRMEIKALSALTAFEDGLSGRPKDTPNSQWYKNLQFSRDPIFKDQNGWGFYDEGGQDDGRRFETKEEAIFRCACYCAWLGFERSGPDFEDGPQCEGWETRTLPDGDFEVLSNIKN